MKPIRLVAFAAVFACAPVMAQTDTSEAAKALTAEEIRWPVPWKVGQVLTYETEGLDAEQSPKKREKVRTSDTTTITIVEASEEGYLQRWVSSNPRFELIEGDPKAAELMQGLDTSLADLQVLVELDKEATYRRIRNIDEISARMRTALEPMILEGVEKGVAETGAGAVDTKAAIEKARPQLERMLQGLTSPAYIEAAMGQILQTYNAFVGISLEDGASYTAEAELDNPMGGKKFPSKIEFGLYTSEEDPQDVFVEWTSKIDPERGAEAAWEVAEKLVGMKIPAADRKDLPKQISIVDTGFLVFNRGTGVIEMYENERTIDLAETHKSDRDRMRLTNGEHAHHWKEEGAEAENATAPKQAADSESAD